MDLRKTPVTGIPACLAVPFKVFNDRKKRDNSRAVTLTWSNKDLRALYVPQEMSSPKQISGACSRKRWFRRSTCHRTTTRRWTATLFATTTSAQASGDAHRNRHLGVVRGVEPRRGRLRRRAGSSPISTPGKTCTPGKTHRPLDSLRPSRKPSRNPSQGISLKTSFE